MIIQKVIKGVNGITQTDAEDVLRIGITCNWWRKVGTLPRVEIPLRLTERNLNWHQNRYEDLDPNEGNEIFKLHSPFISTTAGSVQRDAYIGTNMLTPAWQIALRFATNGLASDGWLFYCYVLLSGRRTVAHEAFSEEIRELNVYTGFSPYQPEGEITSKIVIPPTQIEKAEFWSCSDVLTRARSGLMPQASAVIDNPMFVDPSQYSNVRDLLQ